MNKKQLIAAVLAIMLLSSACRKEETTWDADFTVPIAKTTLSINQLIADSLLVTNPNNHIIIAYNNRILNYGIDSILTIPDTVTSYAITTFITGTVTPGQTIASSVETKSFSFEPARISQVDIENGFLVFTCLNPLSVPLKITYSIPAAKRYGVPFLLSETIPAAQGGVPYRYENKINLSSYSIDMRGPNSDNCNRFLTSLTIVTDPNGASAEVVPGLEFKFYTNFEKLQLRYVKGYLGNDIQTTGPDSSYVEFFKKITGGTFSLNDIDVKLKISNGIGADITMVPQMLKGVNTRTSQEVALTGDIIGKSCNITRSSETHQYNNPVTPSIVQINFANTNILSLIEALPDLMIFKSTMKLNPMGNISCGNDYIYARNGLTADLNMKIPLTFKANTLTLADTINYTISENNDFNSGSVTLMISNSFPMGAKIKLFILDANSQITDEITAPNQTISAGSETSNNIAVPSNSILKINFPKETLTRFLSSKKLLLVAELNTAGSNFVSINAQSKIQLKIVGNFNTNIHF